MDLLLYRTVFDSEAVGTLGGVRGGGEELVVES